MNSTNSPLVAWRIYDRFTNVTAAKQAAGELFVLKHWVTVQQVQDVYLVMYIEGRKYYV